VIASVGAALARARPARVVGLSTVGAQAIQTNLLSQLGLLEQTLRDLPVPVAFLRAAWFMENAAWDVASVRATGVLSSFLQPLDRAIPMVSSTDEGHAASDLLQETWTGTRTVELAHPVAVSPDGLAQAFTQVRTRRARAGGAARNLGSAVPGTGHAASVVAHAHAGRVQRGLDCIRRPRQRTANRNASARGGRASIGRRSGRAITGRRVTPSALRSIPGDHRMTRGMMGLASNARVRFRHAPSPSGR